MLSEEISDPSGHKKWSYVGQVTDDPLEYIDLIAGLQNVLIRKTQKVIILVQKQTQAKDQIKRLAEELKKGPGVEVAIQINRIREYYNKVISQLKSTAAEINVYRYEINQAEQNKENARTNLIK